MNWLKKLLGTSGTPEQTAAPLTTPTKVYRARDWNLEFDLPADWTLAFENRPDPPNYGVFAVMGQRSNGPRPSVLLVTQVTEDTGAGLDAYIVGAENQLAQMFRNFSMLRAWKDTYQGAPSALLEYAYDGNSGPIQELSMTTFFGEGMRLNFQFICEADRRMVSHDRALQQAIIDSIRIGHRGIRVPYLTVTGPVASTCAVCGAALSRPNALFQGVKPVSCLCDKCWCAPTDNVRTGGVRILDLRSDRDKKNEQDGRQGIDLPTLTSDLFSLLVEARAWGAAHGWPPHSGYPQRKQIEAIGEAIHKHQGFDGMQKTAYYINAQNRDLTCHLTRFWNGIGSWRA